ncbi:MAG: HD domain-containing protein [Oscillospiraceae bacterium]|nr:HD domain-containing protein [Oscillospiraceae bacterium]
MDNTKIQLAVGSLLHDTGKIIYRSGSDGRKHSISGYEFVKRFVRDKDLLDCIRYHHADLLKNADVDKNALCYITYIADNIASMERRKDGNAESGG